MDIQNKNIIITGAARGLGKAMAFHLAKQGANISLLDLDSEDLQQTAQEIKDLGVKALPLPTNVSDEKQVISAVEQSSLTLGPVHALINNAGILRDGLLVKAKHGEVISKLSYDQWQSVINVNLSGVFLCGREVVANMIESGTQGVIINIASISRAGNFGQSNYSAAKAGVVALTTTWASELARHGIRSAAIAPGMIATEMTGSMKPEALEKMNSAVPVGRMGSPDEIAQTVSFILANDYFNGRVLELDGGLRL